jgi:hypothetical protein
MAGYTGEKRWRNNMNSQAPSSGVSELTKQVCAQMIDALTSAEAAYAELQELYSYAGGTVQDLADLLFTEDIAARGSPGTNAVVTYSADSGGTVVSVSLDNGGTGYTDGNYQRQIPGATMGGTLATFNYTVSNGSVTSVSLVDGGNSYELVSGKQISNFPLAGIVPETTANSEEVAKAQAAFDAITALHELYQAADNIAVAQEDRLAQIRKMT